MSDNEDQRRRMELFFQEISEVMERHGEIASRFVLAEMGASSELQTVAESGAEGASTEGMPPAARAAETAFALRAEAARQRICVRFGVDPRNGQQVCLQWIEIGG